MTDCGYLPEVSYTHPNNIYSNIFLIPDQNMTFENNELGFFNFYFLLFSYSYYIIWKKIWKYLEE